MKVRYTVPSDQSRVGYLTNGSTQLFSVPFVFFDDTDLQVILVNNTTAVETVLTLTTDYTVAGGGGANGSVTTVLAYASGSTLVLQREVPYTQEIDYQANDGFPAEVNEEGLDRGTMQVQQVRRRARQTPKLPATYDPESGDITMPMPVAGKTLVANEDETGWDNVDFVDTGAVLPTIIGTLQDRDLLEYDSGSSVWRNQVLATVMGRMLTTNGDIIVRKSGAVQRLGTGTAGQLLGVGPLWVTPSIKLTTFTSDGTWTVDANMRQAFLFTLGSGGGGGGTADASVTIGLGGSGGGAGSWALALVSAATAGASQVVTVGAAGAAGASGNNAGGNGGDVSIGALCVGKGGTGGLSNANTSDVRAGGAGGVAGTGDITSVGASGLSTGAYTSGAAISHGGSSFLGSGGRSASTSAGGTSYASAGGAASGYGSGGGGGTSYSVGGAAAGGAGSKGIAVIIEIVRP